MMEPNERQIAMLRRAKAKSPWQTLESDEVIGEECATIVDTIRTERLALADPDLLECERNGWLLRKFEGMRFPSLWWRLTDAGRAVS